MTSLWVCLWTMLGLGLLASFYATAFARATIDETVPWALKGVILTAVLTAIPGFFVLQADFWIRSNEGIRTYFGMSYFVGLGLAYAVIAGVGIGMVRPLRRRKGLPDKWG